jgi:hypothetical protein
MCAFPPWLTFCLLSKFRVWTESRLFLVSEVREQCRIREMFNTSVFKNIINILINDRSSFCVHYFPVAAIVSHFLWIAFLTLWLISRFRSPYLHLPSLNLSIQMIHQLTHAVLLLCLIFQSLKPPFGISCRSGYKCSSIQNVIHT